MDEAEPVPEPVVRGGTRLRRRPSPGRQARYDDEVRRLIRAAQTVMRRCGTEETPRVADILSEAGLSNQAFYRHFQGRDDLVVATFEHGLITLFEYLSHQVAKERTVEGRIRAWVSGVLVQLVDPELVELTRAIFWNVNRLPSGRSELEAASSERIRGLLVTTLAGSPDPGRDATAITTLVLGMTERFLTTRQTPDPADIDHLVRFCLHAIGEPATPA